MKIKCIFLALFLASSAVSAASLPLFNGKGSIGNVHIDDGGPVYLNGKEMKLKKINPDYYEAKGNGIILSIAISEDGSALVNWTGKSRAHGQIISEDDAPVIKGNKKNNEVDCSRVDLTNFEMKLCGE